MLITDGPITAAAFAKNTTQKGQPMTENAKHRIRKATPIDSLDVLVATLDNLNRSFGSEVSILVSDYGDRIVDIVKRLDKNLPPLAVELIMLAKGLELKDKLEKTFAGIGEGMAEKLK